MAPRKPLRDMPTEYLQCRSTFHPWDIDICWVSREGRATVYDLRLKCPRCGARRKDRRVKNLGLDGRGYGHPDGYLVKGLVAKFGDRTTLNQAVWDELLSRIAKPKPEEPS